MSGDYFRTVITVEVLGNEPFDGDLEDLHRATYDGDFSGMVLSVQTDRLTERFMTERLIAQGSDPEFLGIGESEEE